MSHQMQIKDERGTTLIEFTVVLTILLALTFGMIDFGRYVYAISVVRAAAQEASRAGVSVEIDATEAVEIAKGKMIGLDADRVTVEVQEGDKIVNATVTYQFQFISPIGGALSLLKPGTDVTFSTVVITGTSSMANLVYIP